MAGDGLAGDGLRAPDEVAEEIALQVLEEGISATHQEQICAALVVAWSV